MTMIVCGRAEKRTRTRRKQTEFTTEGNEVIAWCFGGLKMGNAMKLYNHAMAPNPRRVRIFAAEKGIELALQDIDILAGQSRTPEFLAKNPSGGVPVLEFDDGSCLAESVAICRYLEGLHPEPNLWRRQAGPCAWRAIALESGVRCRRATLRRGLRSAAPRRPAQGISPHLAKTS